MRPGDTLGPYRLAAHLGAGGMGSVWAADGPEGRVALKVVHAHLGDTPEFLERFGREAAIGMQVRHENVVATLGIGSATVDGAAAHYLVMELVEGRTLRGLLTELTRVPEELCRHIGREIAQGLAALHAAGAVHRDLKPDNVLITRDHVVKVMDLGVAHVHDLATPLSQPGAFVGSYHYAAPEQLAPRGASSATGDDTRPLDSRADLHALGLVLYELATGRHPFDDGDLPRLLHRLMNEKPRRPSELNPQISVFLEEVILQLLEKDRERRFASAADVAHLLDQGEDSAWWASRASAIRTATKRPLRRIRIPRETALHGRESEIETMERVWSLVRAGEGHTVLVHGEAGIGKSRFVDEFAGRRREAGDDFDYLFGSYPPSGAATACRAFSTALLEHFGPEGLDEALAARLRETPLLVPAFASLLRGDVAPGGAEPLTKDSLQTVFVHAVRALAAERPVMLFVDDLDLAPDEGRALFAAVALAAPGHRILLVGAMRPSSEERFAADLERRGVATRLALPRLGPKDLSRLLLDAFRSERLAEHLGWQIAAKSDGNPYFVFEILRGLREGRMIERDADGAWQSTQALREIRIPSSVLDLVRSRLDGLTAEERHVLDVAACAGFEFDPLVVGAALGLSRMVVLQRLALIEKQHRLVRSAGRRYVFDHHQVHEALHSGLSELLREEYHGAIADVLAGRANAGEGAASAGIATHLVQAGRAADAKPFLAAALDHLEGSDALEAAASLGAAVLDAPGVLGGAERLDLLLRHAGNLALLGRRTAERAVIDEALALTNGGEGDPRIRALAAQGWHLNLTGRSREAVPILEEAIGLAHRRGSARQEAATLGKLGSTMWSLGRYDEARASHERQIELARTLSDARLEASAWGNLGLVEYALSRYEPALADHGRQLEMSRALGDRRGVARSMGNLGIVHISLGRWDEARRCIGSQLELARAVGDRRIESIATANLGNVDYALGRWADARSEMERGVALAREVGDRPGEAASLVNLGPLVAELGDPERAADAIDAALAAAREAGARYQEGYALFETGDLAESRGDAVRAAAFHERALALRREIGHRDGVAESLLALGRLRAAQGEAAAARSHLDEAASIAGELGLPGFATTAAVYLAAFAGGEVAAALASLAANDSRMMIRERLEARWLLSRATGDAAHLAEARRLLDHLVANAPRECRVPMVRNVPLHRAVAGVAPPAPGALS